MAWGPLHPAHDLQLSPGFETVRPPHQAWQQPSIKHSGNHTLCLILDSRTSWYESHEAEAAEAAPAPAAAPKAAECVGGLALLGALLHPVVVAGVPVPVAAPLGVLALAQLDAAAHHPAAGLNPLELVMMWGLMMWACKLSDFLVVDCKHGSMPVMIAVSLRPCRSSSGQLQVSQFRCGIADSRQCL